MAMTLAQTILKVRLHGSPIVYSALVRHRSNFKGIAGYYNPKGDIQKLTKDPLMDFKSPDPAITKLVFPKEHHPESPLYPGEYDSEEKPYGAVAGNMPVRMTLQPGKKYAWCSCGLSHKQPLCDGSHKKAEGTTFEKTIQKFRPIRLSVDKPTDVFFCTCKQSKKRPYCDGTHRKLDIQEAFQV